MHSMSPIAVFSLEGTDAVGVRGRENIFLWAAIYNSHCPDTSV